QIPILILTGDQESGRNISCLDQGADDFMIKPFERRELAARVNAILRRVNYSGSKQPMLTVDGISLDEGQRIVHFDQRMIENLTPKEFDLLFHLMKNSPNIVSRDLIAKKVWDSEIEIIHERTIDVHIRRIRVKLGPGSLNRLLTVAGRG